MSQLLQIMAVVGAKDSTLKEWVLHLDMGQKRAFGDGGLSTAIQMAYRFMAAKY